MRKRRRVLSPPREVTAQVCVELAEVRLGLEGLGLLLCGLFTIFNASKYCLLDACATLATMLSSHLLRSLNRYVLSDSYTEVNKARCPCPTIPGRAYPHFINGETEAYADPVTGPRSCS